MQLQKIFFHRFTDLLRAGIVAGVVGVAGNVAAPFILAGVGFSAAGVAAGSIAAAIQVC
jgi:hypothetical protein